MALSGGRLWARQPDGYGGAVAGGGGARQPQEKGRDTAGDAGQAAAAEKLGLLSAGRRDRPRGRAVRRLTSRRAAFDTGVSGDGCFLSLGDRRTAGVGDAGV